MPPTRRQPPSPEPLDAPGAPPTVPGVGAEFGREFRFLQALWELDHALESASRAMKARFGVTGRERLFIRIVGQRPGISPGEVAEMLHVHRSSVTALLKRLERRRLVSRRLDASDARSYRLELAVAGQRINAMEEGTIEAGVRDALAASDPDAADSAALILVSVAQGLIQSTKRKRAGRRQSRSRRRT